MDIFSSVRSRSIKLTSRRRSTNLNSSFSRSNTADYGSLYWTFDPNNHLLSSRLTELVYNKWTLRVWVITWIIVPLLTVTGAPKWILAAYFVLRSVIFTTPYFILLILSFNRDACGFLLRSSEFWIKICYAVLNGILRIIFYHQVERHKYADELPGWLGYLALIATTINLPLYMAVVGGMDAIPKLKYKWKVCVVVMVAIYLTWTAAQFQIFASAKEDYVIHIKATDSDVSFHSLLATVNGMLAMFLWKQIDVLRNKERCISINYRPYLRWESIRNDSEFVESVLPQSSTVVIETAVS